jgi:hypothetical protein
MNGCGALTTIATAVNSPSIETPSRRMEVQLINTELIANGEQFLVEFLLTNHGQNIASYYLGHTHWKACEAYDNLGNRTTNIKVYIGDREENSFSVPQNTPVKIKVIISGVNSKATSFSNISITADCVGNCEGIAGSYVFKNISILR